MLRTIKLTAIDRTVTLADYNQAVRLAKAFPGATFKTGLVRQFRDGMMGRINQAIPYTQRGQQ